MRQLLFLIQEIEVIQGVQTLRKRTLEQCIYRASEKLILGKYWKAIWKT